MSEPLNTIVIMVDQMKATASHLYGNTFCKTPSLGRLADEGVLFQHAVTPHPLCMPARVSFWTSQFPHSHGGRRNQTPMPLGAVHAFQLWKDAGYHTGLIGKNHCFEHAQDLELFDTWCQISHGGRTRGESTKGMEWFRSLDDIDRGHSVRRNMPKQSPRFGYAASDFPLEDYSTGLVAGQTIRFLEEHRDDPFALWVSFPDPHEPWEAPQQYADLFPAERIELPPWWEDEFTDGTAPERNRVLYEILGVREDAEEDVLGVIRTYHAMVRFIDDAIGQILDAVERCGLRDNTVIVFCSDHGDFMGEHAMTCKGGVFYDCLTRVPLIVSCPDRLPVGAIDSSMANLIDIVPTLLTLQGIDTPASMHGQPLPTVTDASPRDATFSEYGAGGPPFTMADLQKFEQPYGRRTLIQSLFWREAEGRRKMVRTSDWKYVHDPMGDRDELYDLVSDPWELTNVAGDSSHASQVAQMRLRLADWSIATEDAHAVPMPRTAGPTAGPTRR
ncbi:MAG: sulfatase-like hydrolase/transferase [Candidatus Latescibacteria bacterium]|nr:sulfatase-like hydrolase/transferase [Candidatus Latescibacterota bacterium]